MRIHLQSPSFRHAEEFLTAVRRSRDFHRGLVTPPCTRAEYRQYIERFRKPSHIGHFVRTASDELAGVINVNEIVRGGFQSAYLGYYVFAPHQRCGYMTAAMRLVIGQAFRTHRLHRLEANIQPHNLASIALVKRLGFRLEGVSPRYLRIARRWRDHERWAVTVEDWKALRRRLGTQARARSR